MIKFECLQRLIFSKKTSKKVYIPHEVYVPLQDNIRLADITVMYVEEFYLFLHYNQEKYIYKSMNGNDCTNVQKQFGCLI